MRISFILELKFVVQRIIANGGQSHLKLIPEHMKKEKIIYFECKYLSICTIKPHEKIPCDLIQVKYKIL